MGTTTTTHFGARRARDSILAVMLCLAMIAATLAALGTPAEAVSETDFEVTTHDLEFILKSIQISEAHAEAEAAGDETYSLVCDDPADTSNTCVPNPRLPWGLRTVTGEHNNLFPGRDQFGAGGNVFPRLVAPSFTDADPVPAGPGWPTIPGQPTAPTSYTQEQGFVYDSDPRLISNLIVDQTVDNPAAVAAANNTEEFGSTVDLGTATPQVTVLEETDPALDYTNAGSLTTITPPAGGSSVFMSAAGAYVEFVVADGFQWFGQKGTHRGIADVYINDMTSPVATIDQYSPTAATGVIYEAVDIGPGPNTVRIVNTGDLTSPAQAARTEIDQIHVYSTILEGGSGNVFIPDVSPDEGLSAPFTGWLTLFGQFFDHGLDMVEKGGNGTVVIPLRTDDPLYDAGASTNFLTLTRATRHGDGTEHLNRTSPFVDQNQTYTSHPSHQVFLREYEFDVDGVPVPTGHLLDGADGGLANWGEVKAQAAVMLGIQLNDNDVLDVPLLATDPYGRFIGGPARGLPQLVVDTGVVDVDDNPVYDLVEGDLTTPVVTASLTGLVGAGQAFLDDIAHNAVPGRIATRPGQGVAIGAVIPHDSALLESHYIAGDGRANENIGLTAVHHVFHSEHNRLVEHIKDVLATDTDLQTRYQAAGADSFWDSGERLFQAARFVTEMQYQHLVFEEFARTISPEIDVQPVNETAYHDSLNAAIDAEFAHVTYRFGHSMLRETVDRAGFGTDEQIPLLDAFLSPRMFRDDGSGGLLTPDEAAAAVIQGMTRQTGNGIDEFVTDTLRNQLLGLPLDLATINMARARDTGSPTLQAAREAFYNETLDGSLKPYETWNEFRLGLKHRASIVNFVAAFGEHPTLDRSVDAGGVPAMTIDELRDAAYVLVTETPEDAPFMNDPAAPGLENVDFWVGGLAERLSVFGGFLGSTFNHVFERQLEKLQNGDRFYYLNRNQGLNLFHQLENNSFTELIMRNTDATLLHANVFANPNQVFDLSAIYDTDCNVVGAVPDGLVSVAGSITYDGGDHVVIHGSACDDSITGGLGDDSIWGHSGNDRLQGDQGNDTLHGGAGDDIIQDAFGDDTVHGGDGNDAINVGSGADLFFGGPGKDFLLHNSGPTTSFAGSGDDFTRGGTDADIVTGNEGDDWMEGNQGHDLLQGDNALTFQNDPAGGADVLIGGPGNDDHDAEGGDDIMLNNGVDRHAGMLGFDWVSHQNDPNPVNSDLDLTVFRPFPVTVLNSRFMSVEGLSGWNADDVLRGASNRMDQPFTDGSGNELTQDHIDRIAGLGDLLAGIEDRFTTTSESNNILLGGEGSDLIEGRAGDDYIDGKSWLRVQVEGPGGERADSIQAFQARVFNGSINPSELSIVREIVLPSEVGAGACDTAQYSGEVDDYEITDNGDGTWTVDGVDGSDVLRNIDRLLFTDGYEYLTTTCPDAPLPTPDMAIALTGDATVADGVPALYEAHTINNGDAGIDEETSIVATATDINGDPVPGPTVEWEFTLGADTAWVSPDELDTIAAGTFGPNYNAVGNWRVLYPESGEYTFTLTLVGNVSEDEYATASISATVGEAPAGTVPGVPTIGTATAGDGQATVTWTAPDDDGGAAITSYQIEVIDRVDSAGGRTISAVPVGGDFTVNGLTNGNGYQFRVRAVNSVGFGTYSGQSNVVTPQAATPPGTESTGGTPPASEQVTPLTEEVQEVVTPTTTFTDVPAGTTFEEYVTILVEQNVTSGCGDGMFCPAADVTREQMATFIVNSFEAIGAPLTFPEGQSASDYTFGDVDAEGMHAEAVALIAAAGITTGIGGGVFGPGQAVSRAEMATFLSRALDLPEPGDGDDAFPFGDVQVTSTHYTHIHRIFIDGITTGTSPTTYSPTAPVSREQMAAFLVRAFELDTLA